MSEDILGTGVDVGGILGGFSSAAVDFFFWLFIILIVVGGLVAGFWYFSFKHRVRVRKVLKNGRALIIDDKARQFKDRNGAVWWKCLKSNLKIAEPPSAALEVNSRGKIYAEGYLLSDGRFVWRDNDLDVAELDKHTKSDDAVRGKYDAMDSEERALYAMELRESQQYKKKNIADMLAVAAPYIAIILIFALFMIFYGDVVQPTKEMAEVVRASNADLKEAMQIVRDVVQHRETLWLEQNNLTSGGAPN